MPILSHRRPLSVLAGLAVLAAAAAAKPPNVLIIMTDQQAADALSCRMGNEYVRTPAMDRLAAEGIFFTRAYAANPLCMPSRVSMLSGRFPHETGVTDNTAMYDRRRLDPNEFKSLGRYFREAGYRTGYFGKWHLAYDPAVVESHGFAAIDPQQKDAVTADLAVKFLAQRHERPFLLVTSFLNPHNIAEYTRGQPLSNGPVGEPPPLAQLPPAPANLGAPAFEPDTMSVIRLGYHSNRRLFPVGHFMPSTWQAMRWGYYRMIEKVDAEIGRVLEALRASGQDGNTLIVFLSDHGECAGAHGLSQKTVFYEESVRVPLIIRPPGGKSPRAVDALVNTGIDLLPTVLDYAGIARPARLPGASLRPHAEGGEVNGWRDHVVLGNHMSQAGLLPEGFVPITEGRMVRTERFKYCVYQHGEQRESLVNLVDDPGEMVDLARDPAYRTVLLEHRELLRRFGRRYRDGLVAELLANDVGPRPFERITTPRRPTEPDPNTRLREP